ncbi:MAG: hypothetical protein ACOY3P_20450 [Planctomycetota bacterium]
MGRLHSRSTFWATIAAALAAGASAHAATPYPELLSWVPRDANALVMISVAEARVSPLAQQKIGDNEAARQAIGAHVFASPGVDYAVLAANVDLPTMTPAWDLALLAGNRDPSLEQIAKEHQGRLETLGEMRAAWIPPGAYLVQLGSRTFGLMAPGDRQFVARWARSAPGKGAEHLAPYLQEAASWPDNVGTEIVLALDLEDALSPTVIAEGISKSKTLADRQADRQELAKLLASIRGVTLGIRPTTRLVGKLRIDFAQDPSLLGDKAKPLVLEALANHGAVIEDLYNWTAEIQGKTVFLGGELSLSGLQRILSLVDPPVSNVETPAETVTSMSDPVLQATLNYFRSLQAILNDVKRPDADKMITSGQYAMWFEKYAKKIDQMPTLNVDPDLLDFGAGVASTLRSFAYGQKDVGFQAAKHSSNPYIGRDDWGDSYRTHAPARGARRMARVSTAESQSSGMYSLDDATAQIRRTLTERYKVQF